MSRISFKNRIALYFSITTALLIFIVFVVIYFTVKSGVYQDLDNDLDTEIKVLLEEINISENSFTISDNEWKEKEHNTLDINPIFIQFVNSRGRAFVKSPNLKGASLSFGNKGYYNSSLNGSAIRQYQVPVFYKEKVVGHILVATPMEEALQILRNLRKTFLITYPVILVVLFSVARFLAGRSITPVKAIIDATDKITRENLGHRIPLPYNNDELYTLSQTINALLGRVENAVDREKQFTSDASHELRTPLAVIKGTLEVLIRKPRNIEEYEEKIIFCLAELNRINAIIDQLLLLARFESQNQLVRNEPVNINALLYDITARYSRIITDKNLEVIYELNKEIYKNTDEYLLSTILDNLVGNAVKYTDNNKTIKLAATETGGKVQILVEDSGTGISEKDLHKIFNPFFRSGATTRSNIPGTGLGLSIVQRLCELLHITIDIKSKVGKGTVVTLLI